MKPFCLRTLLVLLGAQSILDAQTLVDLRTQAKSVDFSAAASTKPSQTGTVLPVTCSVGAMFFNIAAPAGRNLFFCTAANVWTQMSGAGLSVTSASDVVNLFAGCGGAEYLGADGACHTGGGGGGSVVLTTGLGAPAAACMAPSSSNLALYLDTTNGDEWWCYDTNSWKKVLSVSGSGPYRVTGATGGTPSTPPAGTVACYFDSALNTQACLDSSGASWQMLKETTLAGIQKRTCDIAVGDASSSFALTNAQLGPQKHACRISSPATVLEVDVESDAGSPSVVVGRRSCTGWSSGTCSTEIAVNLVSAALAASSGYAGCANVAGTAGLDGGTTCTATLQNTGLNAGDWIELVSGTADGTARLVTVHVTYSVN